MSVRGMSQHHTEDLQPFSFDDEAEDGEDFDGASQGEALEDYDVMNEETFGGADVGADADFSALSERAKMLELGDEEEKMNYPDASTLPMPSFFDPSPNTKNIWQFEAEPSTSKKNVSDDFFSFIKNTVLPESFDLASLEEQYRQPSEFSEPSNIDQLLNSLTANKPKVMTESDLLRQMQEEDAAPKLLDHLFAATKAGNLAPQPPSSSSTSSQNILSMLANAQKTSPVKSGPSSPKPQTPSLPGFGGPAKPTAPVLSGQMPPFMGMPPNMPMMFPPFPPGLVPPSDPSGAPMQGFPSFPPPNFNTLPPAMQQAFMSKMFSMPPGMPPGMMPPPQFRQPPMGPPPMYRNNNSYAPYQQQQQRHYRKREPNLPSNKTISDFAFDPYAGLMSKKEREWLIKIQLIQCMGSGDSWDDDYYYSVWKERNVLAQAPDEWKVKITPKYYNFEDTYPADRYVPPVFNGSLGRPTHVSTSFPRQIIDLQHDAGDDEESQAGKVNTQKKLKGMLMRIENASMALLECRDILYKHEKTANENEEDPQKVYHDVDQKINYIIETLITPALLPTIMLIQKGRQLIAQLLAQTDDVQRSVIINILVQTLPIYTRKVPNDGNFQNLDRAIISALKNMDITVLSQMRDNFSIDHFEQFLSISVFAQHLCLSCLIGFIRTDVPHTEMTRGPLGEWLLSTSESRFRALFAVTNLEIVEADLLTLFGGLSKFPKDSVAYKLSEAHKVRIKQRP